MDLIARHIQDHNEANTTTEKYWGYAERILPCTKDAGTCEYLDAVYGMHVTSMLYTFILWGVVLGILVIWAASRIRQMSEATQGQGGLFDELCGRFYKLKTRLLRDAPLRPLFGRVSSLQVVVLAVILAYLLVFSLVGIVYKTWVTPIEDSNLHNTRTGLGGWSDRVGALAYALTPLTVLLCQHESVLSIITGIPYQHFNFLHRWLGRIIFVQSLFHTIAWTIVEAKLYQPQPSTAVEWIKQQYMIFGVVAMILITLLTVFSMKPVIRWTGYEFFKITHWIIAILYIGACWGHWDRLYCWMVPSLALIVIDQTMRFGRTAYLHYTGGKGGQPRFKCVQAEMKVLTDPSGTVIRLEFEHIHSRPWQAGQHFYLTFPSLSIWQSHPFTVSSMPDPCSKVQKHVYLARVRDGQTKRLAALGDTTVPVIMTGPYGRGFPSYEAQHVLAVAGGTGVTFTFPIIMAAIQQSINRKAVLDFVWIVRRSEDLMWLSSEISQLKDMLADMLGLRICIFVSRESSQGHRSQQADPEELLKRFEFFDAEKNSRHESKEKIDRGVSTRVSTVACDVDLEDLMTPSSSRFQVRFLQDHHPNVEEIVADFRERATNAGGHVEIIGSGPEAMGSDLRSAVAKVDYGDGLSFYWDSRE